MQELSGPVIGIALVLSAGFSFRQSLSQALRDGSTSSLP